MGYLEGFGVTIKKWMTPGSDSGRRVTLQYPEQTRPKPERFHGRHVLNRYADGMEKCIGCELCAGVCPAKCIYVRGADNDPDDPTSPGERFGFIYEINYLRCIHCDLCVEACPTQAITESKLFEFAFTNRADAIYTKAELVVDDDGRPQQLPWENWDGGYDPAELSSGWMRATSPGGDADFVGIVAWASELGYGVRAPEGGGRVDSPVVADLVDDHAGEGHGHFDQDDHDDHGPEDHDHGQDDDHGADAPSEPVEVSTDDSADDEAASPANAALFDAGADDQVDDHGDDQIDDQIDDQVDDSATAGVFEVAESTAQPVIEPEPEPAPAPRPAGLFDAGDADLPDSPPKSSRRSVRAPKADPVSAPEPEPEPEAPQEPVQVPAPEEPMTEVPPVADESPGDDSPADDTSADDTPGDDEPAGGAAPDEPDARPARPMGSGFFDLPEEPESDTNDKGRRRRGWGRR